MEVLKDTKRIHLEIEKLNKNEEKARMLLKLFEDDCKNWQSQYNKSLALVKSYKLDALLTSAFVCYIGVFDYNTRELVMAKWIACLRRICQEKPTHPVSSHQNKPHHHQITPAKFELKTPIQEEVDSRTNMINNNFDGERFSLREDYDFKSIVINQHDNKDTIVHLNRLGQKDTHFINNALLLREFCVLPNVMNWPLIFDPENNSIKVSN